jgi:hypothetical protein
LPPSSADAATKGFRDSLWEIQKSGLGDRGDSRIVPASFALPQQYTKELTMSTSKQDAQAARARAIAEALQASGARSLMELLAESERHKEHLDRLCAKLEALPKIVKKKTRQ